MSNLLANNFRFRRNFSKTEASLHAQNLIGIQRESYEKFLQLGVTAEERADCAGARSVCCAVRVSVDQ